MGSGGESEAGWLTVLARSQVESAAVADLRAELEMARELMVKLTASCGKRDAEMQALRAASVTSGDALEKVMMMMMMMTGSKKCNASQQLLEVARVDGARYRMV